jgi:hypothetical protein
MAKETNNFFLHKEIISQGEGEGEDLTEPSELIF